MRVLVTGGTGLVGHPVAARLAARGDEVRVLTRDPARAARVLPDSAQPVAGDLLDEASLAAATAGCDLVVHAAGLPERWLRDPRGFDLVNREGTARLLAAARAAGVVRVVHVSTMDVFAAEPGGTVREDRPDAGPKPTAYARSKVAAEHEVDAARAGGLDVVVVNPAAVYGPAPSTTGLNGLIVDLVAGRVPVLAPGGLSYVYNQGLADAILRAAERGVSGERYLLADGYAELDAFARAVHELAGAGPRPRTAPLWLLRATAAASDLIARATGRPPRIASGELAFLQWRARVDPTRAADRLGFLPTPLHDGLAATVDALRADGTLPPAP